MTEEDIKKQDEQKPDKAPASEPKEEAEAPAEPAKEPEPEGKPAEQPKEETPAEKPEEKEKATAEEAEAPAEPAKEPEPEAIEQAIEEAKKEGEVEKIELPEIKPGMLVRVHHKIKERTAKGDYKERIQVFEGLVLAVRGAGNQRTFTVRKVSGGVGVEKIFPIAAPTVDKVEVVKQYRVRRAKLWFLKRGWKKRLKEIKTS